MTAEWWPGDYCTHWETWVPVAELQANPRHPRVDWHRADDDLNALAAGMASFVGQMEPIMCTPIPPDGSSDSNGKCLLVLDGHRRYQAALDAGIERVLIRVVTTRDRMPLNGLQQVTWWMVSAHSSKKLTTRETIIGIVRMHEEWENLSQRSQVFPFPSQQDLAAHFHVSLGMINTAVRIAHKPELCKLVMSGELGLKAALERLKGERVPAAGHEEALVGEAPTSDVVEQPRTISATAETSPYVQSPRVYAYASPVKKPIEMPFPRHLRRREADAIAEVAEIAGIAQVPQDETRTSDTNTLDTHTGAQVTDSEIALVAGRTAAWQPRADLRILRLVQENHQAGPLQVFAALALDAIVAFRDVCSTDQASRVPTMVCRLFQYRALPQVEEALDQLLSEQ